MNRLTQASTSGTSDPRDDDALMSNAALARENVRFADTDRIIQEVSSLSFAPARLDVGTGEVNLSRFADGRLAPDVIRPTAASLQAFMERDMSDQVEWLAQRAKARGYADLGDLFGRAPALYTQLATAWRQIHPLPGLA